MPARRLLRQVLHARRAFAPLRSEPKNGCLKPPSASLWKDRRQFGISTGSGLGAHAFPVKFTHLRVLLHRVVEAGAIRIPARRFGGGSTVALAKRPMRINGGGRLSFHRRTTSAFLVIERNYRLPRRGIEEGCRWMLLDHFRVPFQFADKPLAQFLRSINGIGRAHLCGSQD